MFRNSRIGTVNWFSPEIVQGIYYSKEVDIWAYGCFAYELATGKPPLHNNDVESVFDAILNDQIPQIDLQRWSPAFNDFIFKCLKKDP